ncbi:hypothetical protein B566_EDAN004891 [Ephemera danica]|nr:hypothetical protein B566_EDAN004891 [Ephemera danica]
MTNRGAMSIATKVAIQMNCKLGGAPWTVEIPVKGIMVVGFDVSHDTMNKSQSYGAMVASLNTNLSRYYSAVSANNSGEELSNDFSTNLLKALQSFRMCNDGALPSRIIIYRDGVGDGQLNSVLTHEVELIKRNLERIYQGPNYKMAFIVVSKRINTRLFHKEQNPPPGTVVDDCITLPERYDFFIVSQSVRQGSVSPTSYNVISDTSGLDADRMQRFTHAIINLFVGYGEGACSGAVCPQAGHAGGSESPQDPTWRPRNVPLLFVDQVRQYGKLCLGTTFYVRFTYPPNYIMNDLKEWNLGLATNLVKFKGRVLNQESIVQGQRGKELKYPSGANVDWTASLRCK